MRGLVVVGVAWALLGACTRVNPAFGGASDSSAGDVDPTKASAEATAVTDPTAADTVDGDTLAEGSTTPSPSSEAESGPDSATSGDTTGGAPQCEGETGADRLLEVTVDGGEPMSDCPPLLRVIGPTVSSDASDLRVQDCGDCALCRAVPPQVRFKTNGIPLPVVEGSHCIEVVVARTSDCAVRSIVVSHATEHRPLLVSATDTVSLPQSLAFPGGLAVPQVEKLCVRDGCPGAGDYALGFGTASYGPGTADPGVALFDGAFEFDLAVDRAGIDGNCELRIAWDALGVVP